MTACSFAVGAHVCWNWAVRAARTAIPRFILGHTLSTCRSLDMRRLGSIRKAFVRRGTARLSPVFPPEEYCAGIPRKGYIVSGCWELKRKFRFMLLKLSIMKIHEL